MHSVILLCLKHPITRSLIFTWTSSLVATLRKSDISKSFGPGSWSSYTVPNFNSNLVSFLVLVCWTTNSLVQVTLEFSWLFYSPQSCFSLLSEYILSLSFTTMYNDCILLHAPCSTLHSSFFSTSMTDTRLVCTLWKTIWIGSWLHFSCLPSSEAPLDILWGPHIIWPFIKSLQQLPITLGITRTPISPIFHLCPTSLVSPFTTSALFYWRLH